MLVETFADLICPWCYIGRHRLTQALKARPRLRVELRWQPFQLSPDMPPSGMERQAYLAAKFGGSERARQVYRIVEETAERDGLTLNVSRIRRTPNSLNSHRLIRLAERYGLGDAMVGALFQAYFVNGLDIGDRDTLVATAVMVGLPPDETASFLDSDEEVENVLSTDALARQLGLQAVPCYVFNRRYALAGAQEAVSFLPLLDLGLDEQLSETQSDSLAIPPVHGSGD